MNQLRPLNLVGIGTLCLLAIYSTLGIVNLLMFLLGGLTVASV